METIQLYYKGNFRYALFLVDEQYYIIDRRPSHFIGYCFIPLNWIFYHKVYPITTEEYQKIVEKHSKASQFVISASLVGGISVFLNTWMRVNNIDIFQYFNTNLSPVIKGILLLIGLLSSYMLLQILYSSKKKRIQNLIGKNLDSPLFYKLRPEKPLQFAVNITGFQLFGVGLTAIFVATFLYLGNIAMFLGIILMMFILLGLANGAISPNEKWKYRIVDIRKSSDK
ncbi:DUF443 family protein [Streptococcus macacae]|uniref:Tandem five-TM protein n=1 Tax=Streptococcus macacae NCTC 11558 TaxID=764298 RepID=G5JX77_9STRE|nr:DUF443 family protein [Streptococcus macacae]EHJ53056.1 hypothetical protein STRMA_1946 [Streptococcus macacae NCTC 11558]SUN77850.1 tandem five-TM protein [Streptococcus macacae NCTC 11558]